VREHTVPGRCGPVGVNSRPVVAGQSGEAWLFAANLLSPRGEDQGEGEAATEIRVSGKDTARGILGSK
jgi:hypothetical protein